MSAGTIQGVAVIRMHGRFDYTRSDEFRAAYEAYTPSSEFIIDLHEVKYMDSAALGMLLVLRDYAVANSSRLKIRGAQGFVADVLKVAKFESFFTME